MEHMYKKSGGSRTNSGRKPVPDKKKQVFTMVRQSIIDLLGEAEVKRLMSESIKFNGQLDNVRIYLDSDMKLVRYSVNGGHMEIAELTRVNDKLCFTHEGKTYFIADFGRVQ